MKQSVRFGKRSDLLLKLLDKYDEVEDVGEKIWGDSGLHCRDFDCSEQRVAIAETLQTHASNQSHISTVTQASCGLKSTWYRVN